MAATRTASITAAAGTSLTQSLFKELFTFHKSISKKRTLTQTITLSRIVDYT